MKKIFAAVLAAATAFSMSTTVLAAAEKTDAIETTITFDTDAALEYVHTFGNASETGLSYELTDNNAYEGKALKISESFTDSISTRYGGIYFDAADFGLESFAGYTMTVNVKVSKAASKAVSTLDAFSDGDEWVSRIIDATAPDAWNTVSVSVPSETYNDKLGISIPITEAFDGEVVMIDEIVIKDNYGKTIKNIGDIDNSVYEGPNTVLSVITTILFIVMIIAVVLGVGYFVKKVLRTYR